MVYQPKKDRRKHAQKASSQKDFILENSGNRNDWSILILESIEEACFSLDAAWHLTYVNRQASVLAGYSKETLLGQSIWEACSHLISNKLEKFFREVMAEGKPGRIEELSENKQVWCEIRAYPLPQGLIICCQQITAGKQMEKTVPESGCRLKVLKDTELKQADENLRKTQAQLLHAQKMESIGRLAGWIAHDFNNFLTAISGYTELILLNLNKQDPLYLDVIEIQKATNSVAALTRQLVTFSRQQALQPRILNLNEVVIDTNKLLQRLVGEDIELNLILDPLLSDIIADPGQLEQVMINLVVNARDAMPNGGKLTIETANVELDEDYRSVGHSQIKTGEYIMLAVSDTGIGMDTATQQKIFEPFFTTKEVGKGTGLGLAIVHGIVEQSGGYTWVYSEVGVGTTFKIYLPRVNSAGGIKPLTKPAFDTNEIPPKLAQAYTVLVVEDDRLVRDLILRVLNQAGYITLEAPNGRQAFEIARTYEGTINLVLTDIIMPHLRGQQLVSQLKKDRPMLKVVYMSGYSDAIIEQTGSLEQHYDAFLKKPFTPARLLSQLEEVLNPSVESE